MVASIRVLGWFGALVLGSGVALAQLAPNAPKDQPQILTKDQLTEREKLLAPYIKIAQDTYPPARARFLAGLPKGEYFFVVTWLFDSQGHQEQVFIRVQSIKEGLVTGVISSQITVVSGFKAGGMYTCKESEVIDWLISKPDGSEEGNVVGKFLDTLGSAAGDDSELPWAFNAPRADGYAIDLVAVQPTPGTPLLAGASVDFSVKLKYSLTISQHGAIVMVFEDENNKTAKPKGPQVTLKVDNPGGEVTLNDRVTVPKRAKELRLFVPLVPDGLTNTTGEVTIRYPIRRH
jgi:hypothetical protein